jgi:branched-chain amino acid transport system substrate-binding protein
VFRQQTLFSFALRGLLPALLGFLATSASAQGITIGVTIGTRGPGASFGVAYSNAFKLMPATIGGQPVKFIIYEDRADPAEAAKNARKLVNVDKVDALMGSVSLATTTEIAQIAHQFETPLLALAPVVLTFDRLEWIFVLPQRPGLMMSAVVEHMKANAVKTVGYIGFSDPWGDFILNATQNLGWGAARIHTVAHERFARTDNNVSAQVGKLLAADPDAVVVGATGGGGALPHAALIVRGYQKQIYHNHGTVNREFIKLGGKAVEGAIAPSGPLLVAEDLPDDNPIKPVALDFIKRYEESFGEGSRNASSGYSYDAYLLLNAAVPIAMQKAKPGTPEFRPALRAALENVHNVVGTHGVYNTSPKDHSGLDDRARVLVRVENGNWRLLK